MAKITRDLVEYSEIDVCPSTSDLFKQLNLDFVFCIPHQKPDIEQVLKVSADPCILYQEIIKTPVGISLEGQHVTGKKLLVSGDMKIKVEYVACNENHTVHTAHTVFPFCSYIVLPIDFKNKAILSASVLIEDIISEPLDLRCIYNNITLMLVADIC